MPETTTNWSIVGGLVAGAGIFLIVIIVVLIICVFKRRVRKRQYGCTLTGKEADEEFEMRKRGTAVAGIYLLSRNNHRNRLNVILY